MNLHLETLSDAQRVLLPPLAHFASDEGFYLAGGTALALQLGHRRSVDFDFFTSQSFEEPMLLAARAKAQGVPVAAPQVAPRTLHTSAGGVQLSFFGYPYPLLKPEVEADYGLRMAEVRDIACMKLAAIAQRGARKDFVDIHALIRNGLSLRQMLEDYRRKFDTDELVHVLIGLSRFERAETQAMPQMLWDVTWGEIRAAIGHWATEAAPGS